MFNEGMKMATQGMMSLQNRQAVIANNLANVGTAGYRREVMDTESFSAVLNRQTKQMSMGPPGKYNNILEAGGGMDVKGALVSSTRTSYSQGALKMTGNQFDMSLDDNGRGFFTVQGKDGIRFTRNGSFRLGTDGCLVTQDGAKVMGHKGPIKIDGKNFKVSDNGVISVIDKNGDAREVDRFLVTEFPEKGTLKKHGESNFKAQDGFKISGDFRVKQGYLEMANVNAVKEMVSMMETMKSFEANQKVLQAQDQALKKSVNEVGKTQ